MSTEAQMIANRANAQKSTGPRTDAGKENSRGNAVKHGFTAESLTDEITSSHDFVDRLDKLTDEFRPQSEHSKISLRLAVAASVQADMAMDMFFQENDRLKETAKNGWASHQRLEAQKLLGKIHRKPGEIAAHLESSKAGCLAMIDAWTRLKKASEELGAWNEAQVSLALDLLGVAQEHRSGSTEVVPKNSENLPVDQQLVSACEIERLEIQLDTRLNQADESERMRYLTKKTCPVTRTSLLLLRYQSNAARRYGRFMDVVRAENPPTRQTDHASKSAPGPVARRKQKSRQTSTASMDFQPLEDISVNPICTLNPAFEVVREQVFATLIQFRVELAEEMQEASVDGCDPDEIKVFVQDVIDEYSGKLAGILRPIGLTLDEVDPPLAAFLAKFEKDK